MIQVIEAFHVLDVGMTINSHTHASTHTHTSRHTHRPNAKAQKLPDAVVKIQLVPSNDTRY